MASACAQSSCDVRRASSTSGRRIERNATMYHSPGSRTGAQASQVNASETGSVAYRSETGTRRSNGDGDRWLMSTQHSEHPQGLPRYETTVSHIARQKYRPLLIAV